MSLATTAHADAPARLPEVTVTATSDALEEQRAAVAQKTVIERKEIDALGGLTVGEVIRKLPGIEAGEHGADGGMSARSRGMTRDAVQFLVNGERPTANARFALTQIGRLPAGELERIEILRGASAEFGGAAPVTVNLIMRRPAARASSSLKLAAGQRGGEANGQFSVSRGGGEGGFAWLVPVTVNRHGMPVEQALARQAASGGTRTLWQIEAERGDYTLDELVLSPRLSWKNSTGNLTLWPSYYHNAGRRATDLARSAYADPVGGTGLAAAGLVIAAALLRALAGTPPGSAYAATLYMAAALGWSGAFALYAAYSWTLLCGPRTDGGSGCAGPPPSDSNRTLAC